MEESNIFLNDAETAILSIVFTKPSLVYNLEVIKDYMFSSSPNRLIWATIRSILDKSLIPDKEMVINELKISGKLQEAGTESYINYLSTQLFSEENLGEYEKQLINSYKARGVLSLTSGLTERLIANEDVDSIMTELRRKLDLLQDTTNTGLSESINDIAPEAIEIIKKKTENPGKIGTAFGLENIDSFTGGVVPSELWVIAGRPSMGKTALIINSMLSSAKQGNGVLLFSLESTRQQIIERFLSLETGISIQNIRLGMLDKSELNEVVKALNNIKTLPIYIDANFTPSLEYILATIRRMVKQKDVKLVYVDYLQLLSSRGDDDRKEIGRICRSLKLLAKQLGIGIVLLAQVNRSCESRDDKRPLLSDLKESGDIEQDADLVMFLFRENYYNKDTKNKDQLELIVRKFREGAIGTLFHKMEMETNKITGE